MQITPNEIETIEDAGLLDQSPVKMIRTKGGFWIAVGRPKGKIREEALAAGSHPAIVKYNLEKQFPGFQPSLMKSEGMSDQTIVERHSHFLTSDLRKSGHDVYSVQNDNKIDFYITKQNMQVAAFSSKIIDNALVIDSLQAPKEFAKALAGATTEKAILCNVDKIKMGGK